MRMTIHKVRKIKLGDTEGLSRSLYIQSDEGEIEIELFIGASSSSSYNGDTDKLKVFNLFEDKSL